MARRSWLVGLVVLGACSGSGGTGDSGDHTPTGCESEPITLELGTGAEDYIPLADGDPVVMSHGPQGGWHIDTAGIVANSEPEVAILPYISSASLGIDITGSQQAEYKLLVDYDETACTGTFYGTRAFVSTDRPTGPSGQEFVCSLAGETVTLSVRIADIVDLREGTNEVDVVLALDPADVPNCP